MVISASVTDTLRRGIRTNMSALSFSFVCGLVILYGEAVMLLAALIRSYDFGEMKSVVSRA